MDFFAQQAHAQRQTRMLVVLFVLAVVAIVVAVNVAMALVFSWTTGDGPTADFGYPRGFFLTNTLVTVALIGGGTIIEILRLREGGDAVARMAGGRLMLSTSRQPQERRLQNVVEEMAIASGIACPRIYVMERESAINAFAAGFNQNEAVIAVTQGALDRLNRDELQGVIGHEFSHILNGDMRLNMRLIGVLFGIQMVAGFGQQLMDATWVFRSDRRSDEGKPDSRSTVWLAGAALFAVGYIGVFFGRLIKSAVSRQREYLADASAVQFTRNPDGIGNALRKIGGLSRSVTLGSQIDSPQAEQLSHFFLCAAMPSLLSGLFATHPPLEDRLRRIYGRNVDLLDAPPLEEPRFSSAEALPELRYPYSDKADASVAFAGIANSAAGVAATASSCAITGADAPGAERIPSGSPSVGSNLVPGIHLPRALVSALHDPLGAGALVYALLLDDPAQSGRQLTLLVDAAPLHAPLVAGLRALLDRMPGNARLPLLDLAMPALKLYSAPQRREFLAAVAQLIDSDQRVTLEEFVLQTILERRLATVAGRMIPVRYSGLAFLAQECGLLTSLVANAASNVADAAYGARATVSALQEKAAAGFSQLPDVSTAASGFARAAVMATGQGLPALSFRPASTIRFDDVRQALERCNQLAPLAKPALIKLLVGAASSHSPLPLPVADLLSAICTAIDAPMPPSVLACYSGFAWREEPLVSDGNGT